MKSPNRVPLRKSQQGVALPVILMLLVVITMMGVSSIKTGNFQATMSNNARSLQIVDQAAETAIDTVIAGVMLDSDCLNIQGLMNTVAADEILQGEDNARTEEQKQANLLAAKKRDKNFGNNISHTTSTANPNCLVGDALKQIANQPVEAKANTRFCGSVAGVAGFEVGSFVNLKFESRGISKMTHEQYIQTQNIQNWVHLGVDSQTIKQFRIDC